MKKNLSWIAALIVALVLVTTGCPTDNESGTKPQDDSAKNWYIAVDENEGEKCNPSNQKKDLVFTNEGGNWIHRINIWFDPPGVDFNKIQIDFSASEDIPTLLWKSGLDDYCNWGAGWAEVGYYTREDIAECDPAITFDGAWGVYNPSAGPRTELKKSALKRICFELVFPDTEYPTAPANMNFTVNSVKFLGAKGPIQTLERFTVTFDANGGSLGDSETSRTVRQGDRLGELPAHPSNEDKIFRGWYKDGDINQKYDEDSIITSNVILKALWAGSDDAFLITFNTNGANSADIDVVEVFAGGTAGDDWPTDPTKNGWKFKGWFDADGTQWYSNSEILDNLSLTAKWAQYFTVSFNYDGATNPGAVSIQVADGETAGDAWPANPVKTGFSFGGWFDSSNNPYNRNSVITGAVSLKVKWNAESNLDLSDVVKISDGGILGNPEAASLIERGFYLKVTPGYESKNDKIGAVLEFNPPINVAGSNSIQMDLEWIADDDVSSSGIYIIATFDDNKSLILSEDRDSFNYPFAWWKNWGGGEDFADTSKKLKSIFIETDVSTSGKTVSELRIKSLKFADTKYGGDPGEENYWYWGSQDTIAVLFDDETLLAGGGKIADTCDGFLTVGGGGDAWLKAVKGSGDARIYIEFDEYDISASGFTKFVMSWATDMGSGYGIGINITFDLEDGKKSIVSNGWTTTQNGLEFDISSTGDWKDWGGAVELSETNMKITGIEISTGSSIGALYVKSIKLE
jgi:uncharacterized repeat protein (TIGR02543 family)